jgi:hypothetical protein
VVSLGTAAEKLRKFGVETVGIVGTPVDRARLYFRYRPPRYLVGSDPDLSTHRALGVPRANMTDDVWRVILERSDDLARDMGLDFTPGQGHTAVDELEGVTQPEYVAEAQQHQVQFTAQFLIDRDGVIRWSNIECQDESIDQGLERFPTDDQLLAAARAVAA